MAPLFFSDLRFAVSAFPVFSQIPSDRATIYVLIMVFQIMGFDVDFRRFNPPA